jgi:hypothetical protein
MKCISLWQPWATLIAIGAKKIETRAWPIWYRGPLAIHAAKKWTTELRTLIRAEPFFSVLARAGGFELDEIEERLPLGKIVGVVDVVDCQSTEELNGVINGKVSPLLIGDEREFGDFSYGRYGWILENPRQLEVSIPFAGRQGLFELPTWVNARITQGGRE